MDKSDLEKYMDKSKLEKYSESERETILTLEYEFVKYTLDSELKDPSWLINQLSDYSDIFQGQLKFLKGCLKDFNRFKDGRKLSD